MASSIDMVAHCLYHQTAHWERGTWCLTCGATLRESAGTWFCPRCLHSQAPGICPICTNQPWR
jgi:hypothetical protein